ncbi:MAG: TIGR03790 family protein [Thermoguttaceae bacterium]|jgi:uncharacterized protein (TIGR03790 family)
MMKRTQVWAIGLAAAAAVLAAPARTPASAAPPAAKTVTQPYRGVTYIDCRGTFSRPVRMYIVQIDLTTPGIGFLVTPYNPGGGKATMKETTLHFLNAHRNAGARIAINAHFFEPWPAPAPDPGAADLVGLAASSATHNGPGAASGAPHAYSPFTSRPPKSYAILADAPGLNIDQSNCATIVHRRNDDATGYGTREGVALYNTVAGCAQIITDGVDTTPRLDWYLNPDNHKARTAVGLSKDGKTLTLFAVDAAGESQGMNVKEVVRFLLDDPAGLWPAGHGVYNALCLDDGGSTTLAMVDPTSGLARVVNSPSGGSPRAVGSSLALLVRDTARVLVVRNENSPVSRAVADDYACRRGIPAVLSVRCPDSAASPENETISYATYQAAIEKPLRGLLSTRTGIDFIVLTKGVPIRIAGAPGRGLGDSRPSLDSYLAALDYEKSPDAVSVRLTDSGFTGSAWANRFWNASEPFTHAKFGGYLVTRLDGYTEADAKALTTRALAAERQGGQPAPDGKVLLDTCPAFGYAQRNSQPRPIFDSPPAADKQATIVELNFNEYNADMQHAADILRSRTVPVELTETGVFAGKRSGLLGYVSWGSNDRHYDAGAYHSLRFAPGAICETAVSTSARTFLPTTGGQSLIADLIAQGATGAKGYTDEPLLQAVASPSILFDRYGRGWTLAEAFYAASRFVGWEDIVIGDPLCRP